ncbi:MAG: inorganic pyrophosphatase [Candidatus Nitrosoglobus sp.]
MISAQDFARWRPHPWHGLETGSHPPELVHAYIEITPFDLMKYEIDKATGYLRVDRPQRSSSLPPALYGFIPRTYCGDRVASLCEGAKEGDGDPLDICVLSERPISRSEVILNARVVGGLQTIDHEQVDDKIVAVLENDDFLDTAKDISDLPPILIERLRHYFATYKMIPGKSSPVSVKKTYGCEHAFQVVTASMEDYAKEYTNS